MNPTLWNTYTAAPHRVMFLGGVVQLILAMSWWVLELTARYTGAWSPFEATIFTTWAHAWLMLFGIFPLFMFGFLMTTYPRWMGGPLVTRGAYVGGFLLQAAGVMIFYAGLALGTWALMLGVAVHVAGFAVAAFGLLRVYRSCAGANRHYESHLNVALALGVIADAAYLLWIAGGEPLLLQISLRGALWLFLVPVLVLVGHRMIPFFSSAVIPGYRVIQPRWTFSLLWTGAALHFLLETAGQLQWLFPADAMLLFLALHHTLRWGFIRSLSNRLLASLHIAFAFLSLGLMLSVVQSIWLLITDQLILGRAPLHAVGIGFIGGMVVAMVTRVSRGHSGRPLVMDRLDWYVFLAILSAALLRIFGDVASFPPWLNAAAGFVWMFALVPWAAYYIPIYLRPRMDGKAG